MTEIDPQTYSNLLEWRDATNELRDLIRVSSPKLSIPPIYMIRLRNAEIALLAAVADLKPPTTLQSPLAASPAAPHA